MSAWAHGQHYNISANDRTLITLPMHFGYCNTAQIICTLGIGGTLVVHEGGFLPRLFWKLVEVHKITLTTMVPTMLMQLLQSSEPIEDISSLNQITFGGAPFPKSMLLELLNKFPSIDFCQTYGLTEAGPRVSGVKFPRTNLDNHSGTLLPNVSVKVIGDNGIEMPKGEIGEILVKSPGVMKGYYKQPEETSKVISDGWLSTGDLGYLNESLELYITGRLKNIIIRGGINIYPEEIENYLLGNPSIKEVLVEAKLDKYLGEVPVAKIVRHNLELRIEDVICFCRKGLANYKIPLIEFVNELPKTYNKKIIRSIRGVTQYDG